MEGDSSISTFKGDEVKEQEEGRDREDDRGEGGSHTDVFSPVGGRDGDVFDVEVLVLFGSEGVL